VLFTIGRWRAPPGALARAAGAHIFREWRCRRCIHPIHRFSQERRTPRNPDPSLNTLAWRRYLNPASIFEPIHHLVCCLHLLFARSYPHRTRAVSLTRRIQFATPNALQIYGTRMDVYISFRWLLTLTPLSLIRVLNSLVHNPNSTLR
jgi:hypothetical protein